MVEDGKFRKYALYAVGEIILITIGLFIAMQLNTVKDRREARNYELKMLREVQKTLVQDRFIFGKFKMRAHVADSCANVILEIYGSDGPFPDSLIRTVAGMMMGVAFTYNKGAYEAIKSTGLDRISDDSLRNALITLYDNQMPRTRELIRYSEDNYQRESLELFDQLFPSFPRKAPDGEYRPRFTIPERTTLQNEDLLRLIAIRKGVASAYEFRLDDLNADVDEVLALMERRLGPPDAD